LLFESVDVVQWNAKKAARGRGKSWKSIRMNFDERLGGRVL